MKQETQSFFIALSILSTKCLISFQEQTKKLEGTKTCFLTSLLPPPFSFCSYLLLYILAFFSEASKGLQQEILIIQFFSFVYFFLFFSFLCLFHFQKIPVSYVHGPRRFRCCSTDIACFFFCFFFFIFSFVTSSKHVTYCLVVCLFVCVLYLNLIATVRNA